MRPVDGEVFCYCIFSSVGLTPRLRPSSSSRPPDGHHARAAAAERLVKAAAGTAGKFFFVVACFYVCYSRLAGASPPPTRQSPLAVVGYVQPLKERPREHRHGSITAGATQRSTAAEVRPREVRERGGTLLPEAMNADRGS